jgi:hypothetical protein
MAKSIHLIAAMALASIAAPMPEPQFRALEAFPDLDATFPWEMLHQPRVGTRKPGNKNRSKAKAARKARRINRRASHDPHQ